MELHEAQHHPAVLFIYDPIRNWEPLVSSCLELYIYMCLKIENNSNSPCHLRNEWCIKPFQLFLMWREALKMNVPNMDTPTHILMSMVKWASTLSLKPAESQWAEEKQNGHSYCLLAKPCQGRRICFGHLLCLVPAQWLPQHIVG